MKAHYTRTVDCTSVGRLRKNALRLGTRKPCVHAWDNNFACENLITSSLLYTAGGFKMRYSSNLYRLFTTLYKKIYHTCAHTYISIRHAGPQEKRCRRLVRLLVARLTFRKAEIHSRVVFPFR